MKALLRNVLLSVESCILIQGNKCLLAPLNNVLRFFFQWHWVVFSSYDLLIGSLSLDRYGFKTEEQNLEEKKRPKQDLAGERRVKSKSLL